MKYVVTVVVSIALLATMALAQSDSTTSSSASTKTFELSFSGGRVFPYQPYPFKDFWKTGVDAGMGIGYSLEPGTLGYSSLFASFQFASFPFDKFGFLNARGLSESWGYFGDATTAFTFLATYKGTFSTDKSVVAPYFSVGVGGMVVTSGEITAIDQAGQLQHVRPKETRTGFGWEFGVGVDMPAGDKFALFAEGKFTLGFTSDPTRQYFPVNMGVRFRP